MDDASFIAAILAAPDDDAPRLVCADWLEERGQPERAEIIRVQVSLAAAEPYGDTLALGILRRREGELLGNPLRRQRWDWAGQVFKALNADWEWRRGFVDAVVCRWEDWRDHGDAILKAQPVREVRLTAWPFFDHSGEPASRADCLLELRRRWPGVKFTLPPDDYPASEEQMRDFILRAFGVPLHLVR